MNKIDRSRVEWFTFHPVGTGEQYDLLEALPKSAGKLMEVGTEGEIRVKLFGEPEKACSVKVTGQTVEGDQIRVTLDMSQLVEVVS